jgi:hypothetical protein
VKVYSWGSEAATRVEVMLTTIETETVVQFIPEKAVAFNRHAYDHLLGKYDSLRYNVSTFSDVRWLENQQQN